MGLVQKAQSEASRVISDIKKLKAKMVGIKSAVFAITSGEGLLFRDPITGISENVSLDLDVNNSKIEEAIEEVEKLIEQYQLLKEQIQNAELIDVRRSKRKDQPEESDDEGKFWVYQRRYWNSSSGNLDIRPEGFYIQITAVKFKWPDPEDADSFSEEKRVDYFIGPFSVTTEVSNILGSGKFAMNTKQMIWMLGNLVNETFLSEVSIVDIQHLLEPDDAGFTDDEKLWGRDLIKNFDYSIRVESLPDPGVGVLDDRDGIPIPRYATYKFTFTDPDVPAQNSTFQYSAAELGSQWSLQGLNSTTSGGSVGSISGRLPDIPETTGNHDIRYLYKDNGGDIKYDGITTSGLPSRPGKPLISWTITLQSLTPLYNSTEVITISTQGNGDFVYTWTKATNDPDYEGSTSYSYNSAGINTTPAKDGTSGGLWDPGNPLGNGTTYKNHFGFATTFTRFIAGPGAVATTKTITTDIPLSGFGGSTPGIISMWTDLATHGGDVLIFPEPITQTCHSRPYLYKRRNKYGWPIMGAANFVGGEIKQFKSQGRKPQQLGFADPRNKEDIEANIATGSTVTPDRFEIVGMVPGLLNYKTKGGGISINAEPALGAYNYINNDDPGAVVNTSGVEGVGLGCFDDSPESDGYRATESYLSYLSSLTSGGSSNPDNGPHLSRSTAGSLISNYIFTAPWSSNFDHQATMTLDTFIVAGLLEPDPAISLGPQKFFRDNSGSFFTTGDIKNQDDVVLDFSTGDTKVIKVFLNKAKKWCLVRPLLIESIGALKPVISDTTDFTSPDLIIQDDVDAIQLDSFSRNPFIDKRALDIIDV